jgi:hypothetical protein
MGCAAVVLSFRREPSMDAILDLLPPSIDASHGPAEITLTLPPEFQGLPDTAHGGTVLAVFDAVTARAGAREISGHYRRRVPLGTPLRLTVEAGAGAAALRLVGADGHLLVDGEVRPASERSEPTVAALGDSAAQLPVSFSCFVCGRENARGLRARPAFDDVRVGTVWAVHDRFRTADGAVAPLALTALLDETAFWLGALATGESGMTTELHVTLGRRPTGNAIVVIGDRGRVRPRAGDPRYVDTEAIAFDEHGEVARAAITFVAVRGAARKLARAMLATNGADAVARVFPAYVSG